jgi:hypothetical protein
MPSRPLPCHADAKAIHLRDLGHLYQFDFDLYSCEACDKSWVWAFSSYGSDWENVTEADAERMQAIPEPELRPWMKVWAADFN